jgi:glutathione S-transferase
MKLIGSLTSPFVRKVRIVMAEKKLDYELVLEDVWSPDTHIQTFNPLGKIPCLVMEDGEAVFDSRVICEYLDALSPVGRLIPPSGRERAEVRCWEALADGIMDAAVLIRIESTQREPAQRNERWTGRQHGKIAAGLSAMAKGLGDKPWCAGNRLTLADVALGCSLGFLDFRLPQLEWRAEHPNLEALAARLALRQSFVDTPPPAA